MKNKIFFPGLNELRAFAALLVVFHHLELYKRRIHLPSLYDTPLKYFLEQAGKNGVYLFFVLSGFLITYLLLSEIKLNGRITLRNFYIRRILRIWPLYFLIAFLGFLVLPLIAQSDFFIHESYYLEQISNLQLGMNLVLYLFFFSNLAMILFGPVAGASQSWSVSVEEHFYAFWPLLMNFCRRKPWIAFGAVIIMKPVVMYGLAFLNNRFIHSETIVVIVRFLNTENIELMAMGGMGAWLFFHYRERLQRIFSKGLIFSLTLLLLFLQMFFFTHLFTIGITFLALIFCFICRKINFSIFNFLGTISYGIYMFHPLVMFVCFAFVNNLRIGNLFIYSAAVYLLVAAGTIALSSFSFPLIEKRFLNLKEKFSIFISGKATERV